MSIALLIARFRAVEIYKNGEHDMQFMSPGLVAGPPWPNFSKLSVAESTLLFGKKIIVGNGWKWKLIHSECW